MKLLGISIDYKLKIGKQVDILCKNAARQLNVLYRFKGTFDLKDRGKIDYKPESFGFIACIGVVYSHMHHLKCKHSSK